MVAPARILIVDDAPDICKTFQAILEHKGYHVETASTCRQARECITHSTQTPYHVALIDIRLPDGVGTDVLKTVKRCTPTTTCLMMTAYPTDDTERLSRDLGAQDYFVKPFTVEQLLALIANDTPQP